MKKNIIAASILLVLAGTANAGAFAENGVLGQNSIDYVAAGVAANPQLKNLSPNFTAGSMKQVKGFFHNGLFAGLQTSVMDLNGQILFVPEVTLTLDSLYELPIKNDVLVSLHAGTNPSAGMVRGIDFHIPSFNPSEGGVGGLKIGFTNFQNDINGSHNLVSIQYQHSFY
jgi:hypothetical protein